MHGLSFKRCFCLALAAALGACATTQPGIKVEYVDKPVITEKACLDPKDVPDRPARLGAVPASVEVALSTAMAKVSEWTRYGNKADPIMRSCAK